MGCALNGNFKGVAWKKIHIIFPSYLLFIAYTSIILCVSERRDDFVANIIVYKHHKS